MLKNERLQDQACNVFASLCVKKLNSWYQCFEMLHITLHIGILVAAENNIEKWILSVVSGIYSIRHIKRSLQSRHLERNFCWRNFTSFLKFDINRISWGVLVRQLMKNDDLFAVLNETFADVTLLHSWNLISIEFPGEFWFVNWWKMMTSLLFWRKKNWRFIHRGGCECKKDWPIRMKSWKVVTWWKLDDCEIKPIN